MIEEKRSQQNKFIEEGNNFQTSGSLSKQQSRTRTYGHSKSYTKQHQKQRKLKLKESSQRKGNTVQEAHALRPELGKLQGLFLLFCATFAILSQQCCQVVPQHRTQRSWQFPELEKWAYLTILKPREGSQGTQEE